MKLLTLSPVLFGIDLRQLSQDWSQALRLMAKWPIIRWLTPRYATRLLTESNAHIDCMEQGDHTQALKPQSHPSSFQGRVLTPSHVLWHSLKLPHLSGDALAAAVGLEAQRLSPFAPEDQLFAFCVAASADSSKDEEAQSVWLAMTARHLLPLDLLATQEVWAQHLPTQTLVMFKGFGESRRYRKISIWRGFNVLFVFLTLLALAAAAVTPSAQLLFRGLEAAESFRDLTQKSAKAMAERERMSQNLAQIQKLQAIISTRMVPENVLLLLTRYLPDDTFLLSLEVKGNRVNIVGQTPNALALMQQLGKQPGISKVIAPNPSRKEGSKEIFNIEFTLDPVPLVEPS